MEKQEQYTVDAPEPEYAKFTLRLPTELLIWFRRQAEAEQRKITGEMVLALKAWQLSKENSKPIFSYEYDKAESTGNIKND